MPGYEGIGWQGMGAPRSTPPEIIDKLNGAINAGLADPKFKSRFNDLGAETLQARPLISASSSSTIPRNGQR